MTTTGRCSLRARAAAAGAAVAVHRVVLPPVAVEVVVAAAGAAVAVAVVVVKHFFTTKTQRAEKIFVHAHQAKKKIKLQASRKTALTEREEGSLGQA